MVDSNPLRAIGYLRVSTDRQDLSPDAQREAIASWAQRAGATVVSWHEDLGVSGGAEFEKRPGLIAAVDALPAHGAATLVVARRDRLARDVLTAALVERLCERHGARVQSADGTGNGEGPEAQLLRGIMDVFAAYERAVIRSRTKAALAVKRARGERVGTIPYGYRLAADGKHLEKYPVEQRIIEEARRLRSDGLSLRAVGRELTSAGHQPRRGRKWHVQVVKRLVES